MSKVYDIVQDDLPKAPSTVTTSNEHTMTNTTDVENASEPPSTTTKRNKDELENTLDLGNDSIATVEYALDSGLELEKSEHERNAKLRAKVFESILADCSIHFSWKKYVFYIFYLAGIIIMSALFAMVMGIIPNHNVFLDPAYWYEISYCYPFYALITSLFYSFFTGYCMNLKYIRSIPKISVMYILLLVWIFVFHIIIYFTWTYGMGYHYPIPFTGFLMLFAYQIFLHLVIWFQFPSKWRKNTMFQRRMKQYIMAMVYFQFITIQYVTIGILLTWFQNEYQPILAILIPIIKEINTWIYIKFLAKSSNGDVSGAKFIGTYHVAAQHAVILCYIIGSIATKATTWLVLGLDFVYNIYTCLRIVWMKKRHPLDVEVQIELLQVLALTELLEFIAPLSFLSVLVAAYFGPNAELLGSVGSSLWHYQKVEDIHQTLGNILIVFVSDLLSLVISSIMLWIYCRINLYKAIFALLEEFGFVIFAGMAVYLASVSRKGGLITPFVFVFILLH
jgi:hypothetical protein